ncbi:MAG: carbohydrate ABC transporter permease [Candidatus Sumerlaeia bacterium]|nr:carbohydrate ABC transporter permease [Candidatus Sumerlaeia bacterium]
MRGLRPTIIPMVILMTIVLLIMVGPFLWMLTTSLKTSEDIVASPPTLLPSPLTWTHFQQLFQELDFFRHLVNSVIVTLGVTVISLFLNSLGGYAFAKFNFPLRNILFAALVMTMMVPMQVTMLPGFLILKELGLLNSLLGLIIPGASSVFGIFLMRQYMFTIPNALMESGRLDGCGEFRIFWSIILPQCKPVLAALGLFTFMGAWQDFLFPLIILHDESKYTLPVALATLSGQHATDWGLLMAGAIVTILPIAIVFIFTQRRFVEGITMSGMK